jgi:hypothetical protein
MRRERRKGWFMRALLWPIAFQFFKRDLHMDWRNAWRATHQWVWWLEWDE